ncbi:MAG TPA: hypothetical protein VF133_18995 [Terriglobales bacterium]
MKAEKEQEWQKLCREAAQEQDAERLLAIIDHINRMLWEKEQRLKEQPPKQRAS